jgi:hypothetical protein
MKSKFPPTDIRIEFPFFMAILPIRQIHQTCRSRENSALRNGFESSGVVLEWYGKVPDGCSNRLHLSHWRGGKPEEQSSGSDCSPGLQRCGGNVSTMMGDT